MKDPLAVFSTEWLVTVFHMSAVVVVRHPAAVVSSYKTLNWSHPFAHFLRQPDLMNEQLSAFEVDIRRFVSHDYDIVDQAALLWSLVHHVIRKYRDEHPDWIVIRHEDVCRNPTAEFKRLFNKLNLEYSRESEHAVDVHSAASAGAGSDNPYAVLRDGRKSIDAWRERLTRAEIARIRERVEHVAQDFYSAEDW